MGKLAEEHQDETPSRNESTPGELRSQSLPRDFAAEGKCHACVILNSARLIADGNHSLGASFGAYSGVKFATLGHQFFNALFYGTPNGARVGDQFMSLIHTCRLNGANPFDYLTALQRHADRLAAGPSRWMPRTYRDALG